MPRIIFYPLAVLALLTITTTCYSQNIFWLSGSWQGKAYFPGSDASQNYDAVLKVFNVKGNKFEGVMKIIEPSDTSVHFDSKISGIVYDKYLIIKRDKILYLKNAPGIQWKVSCNNCTPPRMIFSIEKGKFFFKGEEKDCYKECNGITEFSKDITEFDSSAKETIYALVNGIQNFEASTALLVENNPSVNTISSPAEDNSFIHRIAVMAAGTITLTERNTTLLLSQKPTGFLQKNPSVIIRESEPKRINILSAGTIVLSSKQSSILPQKQSYSLLYKTPSIKIKEAEQIRIPVLPAGSIVSIKIKTSLPIYRKVSRALQRNTSSVKVRESTQLLVQNKLASYRDTVSITNNKTSLVTEKALPAHLDTISVLPADYALRKKNVIRTLQVNTDSIVLRVYDNGVVDGDVVSVIYNDQVVIDKLSLTARAMEITIPISKSGLNTLVFHAHNLGEFPPNTAKLEILYGNKKEELTVTSDLTVSSTIDIVHK